MALFDNCLLACDIDGTLIYNGIIPERNIEKIRFFTENGGVFALSTGRSAGAIKPITDKIPYISASVVANGCMIYDFKKDEILDEIILDASDNDIVLRVLDECPFVGLELHAGRGVYVLNRTNETDEHEKYEKIEATFINREDLEHLALNKVLFALDNISDGVPVKKIINSMEHQSDFLDTAAVLGDKERHYIEQIPKGISKASGVIKLAKMLGIKKGNLFAIGDYYNDFEMISNADIGAAPEGSPEKITDAADYITVSVENGAVADFIDYLTNMRRK